jgi:hypothetical protein
MPVASRLTSRLLPGRSAWRALADGQIDEGKLAGFRERITPQ